MFPTLSDLLDYLFHVRLPVTIQTLGFFVALAFVGAYQVFKSEFKRYEADGKIAPIKKTVFSGRPAFVLSLIVNAVLGFGLGYKAGGLLFHFAVFRADPKGYIFSGKGSVAAGLLIALVFILWFYFDQKDDPEVKTDQPVEKTVHPYQLMGLITVSVGIAGVIGAKLFDVAEHLDLFMHDPAGTLIKNTGYSYYGGLIFGALTYLYIGHKNKMKLVHLTDIGSPGMMLAYGIGRIGCQLAGDGDWGIVNVHPKPGFMRWLPGWMWSFRYPHNAINAGIAIPACNGNYCNQLVAGVYPTPFYEVVMCIGCFLLIWLLRKRITVPGGIFCLYLVLNGAERFAIECIRINRRYDILGLALTQAQVIALLMLAGGLAGLLYIAFGHYSNRKSNFIS